ncbi:hypothetical protein QBC40DRAFT_290780 [Triangularia verruculosa]|uniref:Chromo domain-containing protein n=1 Tax=Triangularia verruculosa TaxID=2587418 RepID=A0AAN6XAS4_9PEZI|nr:hypothetical protein QBC40DRAFT_290780 [Triangularia verruculosa]
MPFVEDFMDIEEAPLQLIQSDLQESVEASYSRESSVSLSLGVTDSGPTVVNLHEEEELEINEQFNMAPIPEADMGISHPLFNEDEPAPSSSKKRGRPSRSASGTPAKSTPAAKTPRSSKSVGKSSATPKTAKSSSAPKSASRSSGSKRKAEEIEPEQETEEAEEQESEATPAAKRGRVGRPARTAGKAASARLALKAAKKPGRGRPKGSTTSTDKKEKAATKPKNKGGRPRKDTSTNGTTEEEYEVEAIRDSGIDDKTKAHRFLVKWEGYPESENTWEPKANLKGAEELVREFEKSQKKTKAADAAAKASAPKKRDKPAAEKKAPATKGRGKAKAVKKVAPAKKPVGRPGRRGRSAKA